MRKKRTAPQPKPGPARPARSEASAHRTLGRPWPAWAVACSLSLLALWFAARNAPLGVPLADDYSFLDRLTFQHPLSLFDSMGATYYWRPLSRQGYFTLIGPFLLRFPLIVPILHSLLLGALSGILYRIVRKLGWPGAAALAIATFPLLSESARILLDWPSAAQHLLAMVFAALAIHEALSGRMPTSLLAALAGVLSHESAALSLLVLPFAAGYHQPGRKAMIQASLGAGIVLGTWILGYAMARGHGVVLPPAGRGLGGNIPDALRHAVTAATNLEDSSGDRRVVLIMAYGLLGVVSLAVALRPEARRRLRGAMPVMLVAGAWFVLGTAPLAALLPDWNSWRDSVPSLGFGLATLLFLSLLSPWLGGAFAGLRLVALLTAAPAALGVAGLPPATTSDMSFVRLARLQRIADGTRVALLRDVATLPPHGQVRFVSIPRMAEVGFQGPRALRVWFGDPTLEYRSLGGLHQFENDPGTVVVYDRREHPWNVVVLDSQAVVLFGRAVTEVTARRWTEATELLMKSRSAQRRHSDLFESMLCSNLARAAYFSGQIPRSDSLNQIAGRWGGQDAHYWALQAAIEYSRGNLTQVEHCVRKSLEIDPNNQLAAMVAATLSGAK